jgi:hypothetical protein
MIAMQVDGYIILCEARKFECCFHGVIRSFLEIKSAKRKSITVRHFGHSPQHVPRSEEVGVGIGYQSPSGGTSSKSVVEHTIKLTETEERLVVEETSSERHG